MVRIIWIKDENPGYSGGSIQVSEMIGFVVLVESLGGGGRNRSRGPLFIDFSGPIFSEPSSWPSCGFNHFNLF